MIKTIRDEKEPNKITIDFETLEKEETGSVTDNETIRQIALHGLKNDFNYYDKINPMFTFCALYPEIITYNNLDTKLTNEILETLKAKRFNRNKNG